LFLEWSNSGFSLLFCSLEASAGSTIVAGMSAPSERAGLGATPYPGGVSFRVWAPFAQTVAVLGDFNGWVEPGLQLAAEGDGHWSADADGAQIGQKYKLRVNGAWRIDPRARAVTHSVGDGIIVGSQFAWAHDFTMPPWNELVIYEMHLGTFPDDPVPNENLFDAAAADFWYLRELGINAIHLLPAHEFPTDSSWGYNPAHIFAIESAYGRPEDFKRFIDEAHRHGIAVILDVVYNHLGPDDLPTWQFDGWFGRWDNDDMGGIYFYNDWRANTPWGHKNRPDYGRPEVRRFLHDNALVWLDEFRLDGLRFDATNYIRNVWGGDEAVDSPANLDGWGWNLMRWINDDVDGRQPWKITIAEDMQRNEWVTQPTAEGGAGFDTQWDAGFVHPVREALTVPDDRDRNLAAVKAAIELKYNGDAFHRLIYTESHDEVAATNGKRRLPDAIAPGQADGWYARKRSTLGAVVVMTSPGIPMILQGQEILEWIPFGDENRIDWDKFDQFHGIHTLYGDLIRLRRNWHDNTRGLWGHHVNAFHAGDDKMLAFHRWDRGGPGDDVVVVLNFANQTVPTYRIGFPREGQWWVRFNSDWDGYSPDFGNVPGYHTVAEPVAWQGLPFSGNIGIGPYSGLILSQ
jgi:1,4-alpha-glucan branching enzyme